ncbi:MAG: hypothetical protein H0Z28_13485, partial [Archaeoglobus sp.]|nr:hypothetical protein [Archaeoglobus sp.]
MTIDKIDNFEDFRDGIYKHLLGNDIPRKALFAIFDFIDEYGSKLREREAITLKELGEKVYGNNPKASVKLHTSGSVKKLEEYRILLRFPKPSCENEGRRKKVDTIYIPTPIARWLKESKIKIEPPSPNSEYYDYIDAVCRYPDFDNMKLLLFVILKKHTNVIDPKIDVEIDFPSIKFERQRYGGRLKGRVCEDGIDILNEIDLKKDLRALVILWFTESLSQ